MSFQMTRHATIVGTGAYSPDDILTNADLELMVDTTDEWIASRTGIRERHVVAAGETTSDLAARAGAVAMERAGVSASDVDMLFVGTTSPDYVMPSTACMTQAKLGLTCPACRREIRENVDVGLAVPRQKILHECREGLIEQTLGFRGDGVEHQRRFPRTRDARENADPPPGNVDGDVPEVVLAGAPDLDGAKAIGFGR